MRVSLAPLALPLALPVALWACGSSSETDAGATPDAGTRADAQTSAPDAALEDSGIDAGLFAPDASALDAGPVACSYPAGAAEPMALDRVLSPYAWPSAIDGAGAAFPLDLAQAHCDTDPNRTWAGVDVLLFVTAPAW